MSGKKKELIKNAREAAVSYTWFKDVNYTRMKQKKNEDCVN